MSALGLPTSTSIAGPPARVGTRLISDPRDPEVLTSRAECDERTALTRGLAEYLAGFTLAFAEGRSLRLRKTFYSWAEPEEIADFPTAFVSTPERGAYDAAELSPNLKSVAGDGGLFAIAEFVQPIVVELWATDEATRVGLGMLIRDALSPVEWRSGVLLELPHYHGARADYELLGALYVDAPDSSLKGLRGVKVDVTGRVAALRSLSVPPLDPRAVVDDVGTVADLGEVPPDPAL